MSSNPTASSGGPPAGVGASGVNPLTLDPLALAHLNPNVILGPIVWACLFNCFAMGASVVLSYVYIDKHWRSDVKANKIAFVVVMLLSWTTEILNLYNVNKDTVTDWGRLSTFMFLTNTRLVWNAFTCFTVFAIQLFLAFRVARVSRKWWWGAGLTVLISIALGGGLWFMVAGSQHRNVTSHKLYKTPLIFWLLASVIADAATTASLAYALHRLEPLSTNIKSFTRRMIIGSIETGAIQVGVSLAAIIAFYTSNTTFITYALTFVLPTTYTITFLLILLLRPEKAQASVSSQSRHLTNLSLSRREYENKASTFATRPELGLTIGKEFESAEDF